MATAPFTSATLASDGRSLTVVWTLPSGTWGTPVVDTSKNLWLVVSGQTYRIGYASAGSPTGTGTDTLTCVFTLHGRGLSGDTCTVTSDAAVIGDGTNDTAACSSDAVTNNSTEAIGTALTRIDGTAAAVWANVDAEMIDTATYDVAIAAIDEFCGVSSVDFNFYESDGTTPFSIKPVTGTADTTLSASSETYGTINWWSASNLYWKVSIQVDDATNGLAQWTATSDDVLVEAVLNFRDGTSRTLTERLTLRRRKASPTIVYLDANTGDDGNTGLSYAQAVATISKAMEKAYTNTADELHIYTGGSDITYTLLSTGSYNELKTYRSGTTGPYLTVRKAAGETGNVTIQCHASLASLCNVGPWILFRDVTLDLNPNATNTSFTLGVNNNLNDSNHIAFRDTDFQFGQPGGVNQGQLIANSKGNHVYAVNCNVDGGERFLLLGGDASTAPKRAAIHNVSIQDGGTALRIQWGSVLAENVTVTGSGVPGQSHSPGAHMQGCNCTQVSGTTDRLDDIVFRNFVAYGCGTTSNFAYGLMQLAGKMGNVAVVNCAVWNVQDTQQPFHVVQGTSSSSDSAYTDVSSLQLVSCTIGTSTYGVSGSVGAYFQDRPIAKTIVKNVLSQSIDGASGTSVLAYRPVFVMDGCGTGTAPANWSYPSGTAVTNAGDISTTFSISSPDSGDFSVSLGSDAIDGGAPTWLSYDYNGDARSATTPTIGADEYGVGESVEATTGGKVLL